MGRLGYSESQAFGIGDWGLSSGSDGNLCSSRGDGDSKVQGLGMGVGEDFTYYAGVTGI